MPRNTIKKTHAGTYGRGIRVLCRKLSKLTTILVKDDDLDMLRMLSRGDDELLTLKIREAAYSIKRDPTLCSFSAAVISRAKQSLKSPAVQFKLDRLEETQRENNAIWDSYLQASKELEI